MIIFISMPKRILLIDDNPLWVPMLRELIRVDRLDIEVIFEETGGETVNDIGIVVSMGGIKRCKELIDSGRTPNLVLLDVRLQEADGRDIVHKLRELDSTLNICFFTMYYEDVIGENLKTPIISKQLEPVQLIRSLKDAIEGEHVV